MGPVPAESQESISFQLDEAEGSEGGAEAGGDGDGGDGEDHRGGDGGQAGEGQEAGDELHVEGWWRRTTGGEETEQRYLYRNCLCYPRSAAPEHHLSHH